MFNKTSIVIKVQLKIVLLFTICFFMFNCKTINLYEASQTQTKQHVQLGIIGSDKDFLLQKGFNHVAIPNYNLPIKLTAVNKPFTKQVYKIFMKAKVSQASGVIINYIDSIPNKPKYLQLQIADKVAVVKALNIKANNHVKNYLSNNTYANVLTEVSIAFNEKDIETITKADAIFLKEKSLKTYALQLYNDGNETETILFNRGVVFAYKTSNCCWQENSKHQLNIVDLVGAYTNCPNKTYKSANKAKKKVNYFKL